MLSRRSAGSAVTARTRAADVLGGVCITGKPGTWYRGLFSSAIPTLDFDFIFFLCLFFSRAVDSEHHLRFEIQQGLRLDWGSPLSPMYADEYILHPS